MILITLMSFIINLLAELERLGLFRKSEDVLVNVEYVNPSFLVKKPRGGHRLVTAFTDVGRYAKPQPLLMPNVDGVLCTISQWKFSPTLSSKLNITKIP